eukprot:85627-Rhodomonas_salina.1
MRDTKLQLAQAKLQDVRFGSSTFSGPAFRTWQPTELGALLPDAVVVDTVLKRISLLEFTRPSDTARHTLWTAAKIKEEKYQ